MARKRTHTRRAAHDYPRGTIAVQRGGYAFVQTAEGEFFIGASKLNGAFDGDLVEVAPTRPRNARSGGKADKRSTHKKREARVVRVVERVHADIVGRYEVAEPFGIVIPENPRIPYDIFTQRSDAPDVPDGALVRVAITTYPSRKEAATGVVVEVLGEADDERAPIDAIVAYHGLSTTFPEEALAQAAHAVVDAPGALARGYVDITDRIVFTIDPEDARDYDDAVSLDFVEDDGRAGDMAAGRTTAGEKAAGETGAGGDALGAGASADAEPGEAAPRGRWRLGVHIADVSHYVEWASALDVEARRRSTSAYLVDRVIPMLPEALSCDVCSLVPGEERRTLSVDMFLDEAGRVVEVRPYPAIIRSCARLTYDQAQEVIDAAGRQGDAAPTADGVAWRDDAPAESNAAESRGETPRFNSNENGEGGGKPAGKSSLPMPPGVPAAVAERIVGLSKLAEARRALRAAAGGLDFDTVEARVVLAGDGKPLDVKLRARTQATQLIEEAMIAANEAVATFLQDAGFPCLYRVHEKPERENLLGLVEVLGEFPWFSQVNVKRFVAGNAHELARALAACEGRAEEPLVTTLVLRAMQRAVYDPVPRGHYALASKAYAHFTSPIRRYPDLVVHRMVKAALFGRPEKFGQEVAALAQIAEHSSHMERVAERAARDSQEVKIIELMEDHVGETFSAMIAGVASFGLFVRLENTAEGLVEIDKLGNEYFVLDPVRHTLTGSDTGKQFRLGKNVAARLDEADHRTRTLRFSLVS